MATVVNRAVAQFAEDVLTGLAGPGPKQLSPRYFYDELGSKLFDAITCLPEYGLSRADERLLAVCAGAVAEYAGHSPIVAELGSGSGRKTSRILAALHSPRVRYYPIDVSEESLAVCARELGSLAAVHPLHGDYLAGLGGIPRAEERLLLLFLGSTIGNFERRDQAVFLHQVRSHLRPGDLFLVGADLAQESGRMLAAYDDATGVTAAFNLNVLARINRELGGAFDLRLFAHEAIWNAAESRVEMHLISRTAQRIAIRDLGVTVSFEPGESIWTESSYKFTRSELDALARAAGFDVVDSWVDAEWPFAEVLWRAK